MVRFFLASLLAITALSISAKSAEACGEPGCHTILPSIAMPHREEAPTVAPASDEAEVRAKDLAKLEPQTPAFWMQFKSYAYKNLPTHEERNFKAVWVAMAVTTPDETVAAVGFEGTWW